MKNLLLYSSLSIVMQRIQDFVNLGYTRYVCGSTSVDKIEQVIALFEMNYQASISRYQRSKRTHMGLGNVHLVLRLKGEQVYWWLLATPPEVGRHPIHETDTLKNALIVGERIEIDGFELVRLPKKGTDRTKLTWRMTTSTFDGFSQSVVDAVRSRSYQSMQYVLYRLWSNPGFNGIRSQIGKLVVKYRAEVKRASIKDAPKPPEKLYYLNRRPHAGITVKQLRAQLKSQV